MLPNRGLEKTFSAASVSSMYSVPLPLAGVGDPLPPSTARSGASDPDGEAPTPRTAPTPASFSCIWRSLVGLFFGAPAPAAPAPPLASPLRPGEPSPCLLLGVKAPPPKPLFSSALSLWGGSDYKPRAAAPSIEASPALSVASVSDLAPGSAWAAWPGGVAAAVDSPGGASPAPRQPPATGPRSFFGIKNKPT